ncbi:MAG TPA: PAS domain S-box protein, partial [Acidobacteriota bacterium]|nr:PAS domain S-box protein [Acidobacteriota bacterium]
LTMFGRPREEIVGNKPHDPRLSPALQADGVSTHDKALEKITAALEGNPQRFEWRHLKSDGTPFDSEVSLSRLETGGKALLLAICRDISERKRAEEALRASEEQYRSLITNIPSVTWTSDPEGKTTFVSPNVEAVYGYTPEEIYRGGADIWFGRIHPEDVDRVKSAYAALSESGVPFDMEYRIRRKTGDLIWLHDRATRTYDDQGITRADGVFSDITARKEAEAARAQAEHQYRHIFESAVDALAILTMEGRFVEVNPAMCDLHGFTREEHLSVTPAQFLVPEELPDFEESLEQARLGENFHREVLAQNKDGGPLDLEVRGTVFEYLGKPHVLVVIRDITERKQAEHRLRQVTEQLVEANAALEEKNAALRQILEHLERDKKAYRDEVCESVEKLLLPVVARLKESGGTLDRQDIDVLDTTLKAIVERDIDQFKSDLARLTPRELDICGLIKEGCSSKDIAARLNISSQTVHKHRQLIRRKLRLSNKAVNLAAYLRSR